MKFDHGWKRRGGVRAALILWFTTGLYLGLGGWARLDANERVARLRAQETPDTQVVTRNNIVGPPSMHLAMELEESEGGAFPVHFANGPIVSYVLAALGFGVIGGVLALLASITLDGVRVETLSVFIRPLLGGVVAILVLAAAHVIPITLVQGTDVQVRSVSLLFLCVFAGLFAERFILWARERFGSVLASASDAPGGDVAEKEEGAPDDD